MTRAELEMDSQLHGNASFVEIVSFFSILTFRTQYPMQWTITKSVSKHQAVIFIKSPFMAQVAWYCETLH